MTMSSCVALSVVTRKDLKLHVRCLKELESCSDSQRHERSQRFKRPPLTVGKETTVGQKLRYSFWDLNVVMFFVFTRVP